MVLLVILALLVLRQRSEREGDDRSRTDKRQRQFLHGVILSELLLKRIADPQNFACTVRPSGAVICTAPFGSAGNATGDVPVSLFSPAGSSGMRCGLPSTTEIAVPFEPPVCTALSA